jgi:ubiquinone/menaquinone biosynthesis C-methylase UbiE
MSERRLHWEKIHGDRKPDEVSWHQENPSLSLDLIRKAGIPKDGSVIDVGGGASRLADALLDEGFARVSVLDISARSLARAKERLGARASKVVWIETDLTAFVPKEAYDLWHDRAVFHFLTEEDDRRKYVDLVRRTLKAGGALVLAAFALDGPETCSGLPVRRYDAGLVRAAFGSGFVLVDEAAEAHVTPRGVEQRFRYFLLRMPV